MERWEKDYDRMLAAGPPEPPTADVTVTWEAWVRKDRPLTEITDALGGHAHWAGDETMRDPDRPAAGETLVEGVESYEAAEEIVRKLFHEHLAEVVDLDNLITEAEPVEEDEPDHASIAKDLRIEEDRG